MSLRKATLALISSTLLSRDWTLASNIVGSGGWCAHLRSLTRRPLQLPLPEVALFWVGVWNQFKCLEGCGQRMLAQKMGRQLSLLFPNQLILGLEICVRLRPRPYPLPACFSYGNVACLRCNTMRYLPNFFSKGQLSKMFLLFPEPHFKKTQAQVADVSPTLLAEYTYTLKEGGLVYTNTDMEEVLHWMVKHFSEHPLFTRVPTQNWYDDAHFEQLMMSSSEEGKKVQRNGRKNYLAGFPQSGILKSQYYRYQLYVR
uniref:tRNA (guanine(46)-N(7))-methyltransferase n=1 Tax=Oncorhynchus tshawytscha TaxID=74940 RepID=A0A8C8C6V8_ONCTS